MTTHRKSGVPTLRITQVHSIIGNQERVKRVVTSGLGLGRIGSSVVLPDNPYTRGMIAKAAHIVRFEELPVEARAARADEVHVAVPEAVEKLVEAAVAPAEPTPHRKRAAETPAVAPPEAPSKARPAAKAEPETKAKAEHKAKAEAKPKAEHKGKAEHKAPAKAKPAGQAAHKRTTAKSKE